MTRARLPSRRPSETVDLMFGGHRFAITIGFYPGGQAGEVFTSGVKVGSDLDGILADACVAVSLLLQHKVEPAALARSMGRAGDGVTPASVIGALADLLVRVTAPDARQDSRNNPWRVSGDMGAGQAAESASTHPAPAFANPEALAAEVQS